MSLNSLGPSNGMPNSRMTHSLSTPSGVDGSTSTSHSRGGKKLAVRVQMLDDSMTMFQVQVREETKLFFHYCSIFWRLHCGDANVGWMTLCSIYFLQGKQFSREQKTEKTRSRWPLSLHSINWIIKKLSSAILNFQALDGEL